MFTHYPKNVYGTVLAWVQPVPPAGRLFHGQPTLASLNLFEAPLEPEHDVSGYCDGVSFTRFFGSVFSDQPLLVTFSFSNDECDPDGNFVSAATLPLLNYDAEALKHAYDPDKQGATGRFFVTIYGRWLRVTIQNKGTKATEKLRLYCRGSVF